MTEKTENTRKKLTPGQAAKDWAKEHPEVAGRIKVISLTPKGKGGWGVTDKTTYFYVLNGKAVAARGKYVREEGRSYHNGICQCCGNIFFERELHSAYAPEPLAGQAAPRPEFSQPNYTYLYTDWTTLLSCPECIDRLALDTDDKSTFLNDFQRKIDYVTRDHPDLAKFDYDRLSLVVTLDIRREQERNYA